MNKKEAEALILKYTEGKATPEEKQLVEKYFLNYLDKQTALPEHTDIENSSKEMLEAIEAAIGTPVPVRRLWPRIAAAASILIALSASGYFALHQKQQLPEIAKLKPGTFKNDVVAGNKSILTLGNGKQLAVTSIPAGHITNTNVQKTAGGVLVYDQLKNTEDVYNTLTVPRGGGKHEIRLADGTLAILDAESSIRFPVAFNGKDRRVTITGQVYFEVVHKADQPFFVAVNNQTIEDVGTHFNVNAFDGTVKTTLIEGSIKVNNMLLKPGQQTNGTTIKDQVDLEVVLAWKNDLFKFGRNTSLQTVMNQLSRWYDLDVQYEGTNKQYHFGGYVPRNSKLSDVCKILEYSGVKFAVDGKKIIVYQ